MKNVNQLPSQLWEQWLQRLHGIEDPARDYYRLELLQLLTKTEVDDKDRFFNRLGTILSHSLHSGYVYIYDLASQKVTYKNNPRNNRELAQKIRKVISPSSNGVLIKQFPRGKKVFSSGKVIKNILQLPVDIFPDQPSQIIVLYEGAINQTDKQFLHFVAGLFKLHGISQGLSKRLSQEKKLLELLTHHINEGLFLINKNLVVKIWNRPLQRITGYSAKEAIDADIQTIIKSNESPNWLAQMIDQYKNSGQNGFVFDCQISSKSKQLRWLSISGSFLRDDEGNIEQIIAIVRDISREKQLEQRKNEFISIATHELRTPITAIKGYLSLLSSDSQGLTDKQQSYLSNATAATERLVGLAEDLLQVIRIDEDRMKFSLQPVDLTRIIEKVSADFSQKIRNKGLEFNLTLPPFSTIIIADPLRLEQVFANLLDNAVKYTTAGSISVAFEHYSEKLTKEDKVAVIIKDTGIGIDNRDLDGIFQKFHRSDRVANLREPGAGLGLYIAKSFVERQNGEISVRSRPKRGSSFAVRFSTIQDSPELSVKTGLESKKNASTMSKVK